MKIALVHDWLNTKNGGAERVLFKLAEMFPEAPIYTLIYNPDKFDDWIDSSRIRTSYLQKFPDLIKKRPKYTLPFLKSAIESFDFNEFDIVISSSGLVAKNIVTRPETIHVCYCHTPMRMAWDYWPNYIEEQNLDPFRKFIVKSQLEKLRDWDYIGSKRVDYFIANSKNVKKRIAKYYDRDAMVIYPPVDVSKLKEIKVKPKEEYFVNVSSLTPYKKLDLAIEAFNISGHKLYIAGSGEDRERLESISEDNIVFTGFISDDKRNKLIAGAKGFIFPSEEDFGITPVESMALGTPVIGYNKGGLRESVIHQKTGIFFSKQTPKAINQAVDRLLASNLKRSDLQRQAAKFDDKIFERKIFKIIKAVHKKHH